MPTGIEYLSSQEGCSVVNTPSPSATSAPYQGVCLGRWRTEGILLCEIQLLLVLSSTPPLINPTKKRYQCLNKPSFFQTWDWHSLFGMIMIMTMSIVYARISWFNIERKTCSFNSQSIVHWHGWRAWNSKQPLHTSLILQWPRHPQKIKVGVILLEVNLRGGYRKTAATNPWRCPTGDDCYGSRSSTVKLAS